MHTAALTHKNGRQAGTLACTDTRTYTDTSTPIPTYRNTHKYVGKYISPN